jgi:hypothetical protein
MGIDLPIVQAPAGPAVSEAGASGCWALTWQTPEQARRALRNATLRGWEAAGAAAALHRPGGGLLHSLAV